VYIEGSIRTDKFTGKDGQEKFFTEIVANDMQMLGGGGGEGGGRGGSSGGGDYRERPQRSSAPAPSAPPSGFDENFQDDDIPF
jgi:single-strand DNA-binding protein